MQPMRLDISTSFERQTRSLRRRIFGAVAVVLAASVAAPAMADNNGLPQGYTTDQQLPQLPASAPSGVTRTQSAPAGTNTPAPAPQAQASASVQASGQAEFSDTDPSATTEFRQPLAPYGTWVEDPNYGLVWIPAPEAVGPDFAPYVSAGYWTTTDDGAWYWASDYDWGYIPFHYGRWVWIPGRGWAWIPGRVYAPAWVLWRVGDDGYIGWAPMPPAYYWVGGVAVGVWVVPPAPYVFCSTSYVFYPGVQTYIVTDHRVVGYAAAHTRPYAPAHPTVASAQAGAAASGSMAAGAAASGARMGGAASYRPASPSLAEARIPAGAAPRGHARPDPRAVAYATPATVPQARHMAATSSSGRVSGPGREFGGRGREAPAVRSGRVEPSFGGSAPSFQGQAPSSPGGFRSPHAMPSPGVAPSPQFAPTHPVAPAAPHVGGARGGHFGGGGHRR